MSVLGGLRRHHARPAGFGRLFLLLFVVLVAVGWWLSEAVTPPPEPPAPGARHVPQYYMQDFTLILTTPEGRPSRWVSAEHMVHYADDGTTHLTRPSVVVADDPKAPEWRLKAGAGVIENETQIHLSEGVTARRFQDQEPGMVAHSDTLFFNLESGYAETETPVLITSATGTVRADAMHAYTMEDRLYLRGNVRGRYVP